MEASRDCFILAWAIWEVVRSQGWAWCPFRACCSGRSKSRHPELPERKPGLCARPARTSMCHVSSVSTSVSPEAHLGPPGVFALGVQRAKSGLVWLLSPLSWEEKETQKASFLLVSS